MNSVFEQSAYELSTILSNHSSYQIEQVKNKFSDATWYNDQFFQSMDLGTEKLYTYQTTLHGKRSYPFEDAISTQEPIEKLVYAPLCIQFT